MYEGILVVIVKNMCVFVYGKWKPNWILLFVHWVAKPSLNIRKYDGLYHVIPNLENPTGV